MDTASIQGTFRYSPKIQELRTLTLTIEHQTATILCIITIDQFESENLAQCMEPILFPPGESSTSVLAFTGGPNEYELAYRARSGAGSI
jgi:hypothetical protein